ncbi:MAG: DMT family transporter, partial [candidate division Zixibacteria bacterium]|nr:DMT family transporter [candidate division Zixibacteria bacterium]
MSDNQKFSSTVLPVLLFQQTLGAICFPIAKYGLGTIDPFVFAFYRFVISSAVLLLVVKFRKHDRPVERADYWKIFGLGVIIIPFNQAMYLFGQSLTGAGHGSVLFATTPIWIFLAALVHLKEKVIARRAIGIVLALVGVIITVTGGAIQISTEYLWGDIIILIAVFAWAYYTVLGKPLVRKYGAIRTTAYALASGSALYFPFGL